MQKTFSLDATNTLAAKMIGKSESEPKISETPKTEMKFVPVIPNKSKKLVDKKEKRYKIVEGASIAGLEGLVMLYLKEGWECQGGLAVVLTHDKHENEIITHYQAMTR